MHEDRFFSRINFSSANEDGLSELKALRLESTDRVLCVTASGARVLDLALASPREIVAIDFNPTQNHLLSVKMAAISRLDYDAFLAFVGAVPDSRRLETYAGLRSHLDTTSREFWDDHVRTIHRGILYCGRWEHYLRMLSYPLKLVRPRLTARLFRCESIEDQATLWTTKWDRNPWRVYLRVIGHRFVWKHLLQEPGIQFVPECFSISDYLIDRFRKGARNTLFRRSPFAWLIFYGRYDPEQALPPHLQRENYERLQGALDRIHPVTDSVESYLASPTSGEFDAFSLSDFSSYADETAYRAVWSGVLKRASRGARFCERQFCVKRQPLNWFADRITREPRLEAELEKEDNSFLYSFIAGEIP